MSQTADKVGDQIIDAVETIVTASIEQLGFDRTLQCIVYEVSDLNTGEYRVQYENAIMNAYSADLKQTYSVGDSVYVNVPEGDMSNRKTIIARASSSSLSAAELDQLAHSVVEISPPFSSFYGYNTKLFQLSEDGTDWEYAVNNGEHKGELVAGSDKHQSYIYQCPTSGNEDGDFRLQAYGSQYEYIQIKADFRTELLGEHSQGNYGIGVTFRANNIEEGKSTKVTYRLDISSFNGSPYQLQDFSTQSAVIKVQKNYLQGLEEVYFFQEDFSYDTYSIGTYIDDKDEVKIKYYENSDQPNLFVNNIEIKYVEIQDLSDTPYYLAVVSPLGSTLTEECQFLRLQGKLIYNNKNIINEGDKCTCKWYVKDQRVTIGGRLEGEWEYDKEAGFGWRKIVADKNYTELVVGFEEDVELGRLDDEWFRDEISREYKLVVDYGDEAVLHAEIALQNSFSPYKVKLSQDTEGESSIFLTINATRYDEDSRKDKDVELIGEWYYSDPDGSYSTISNSQYLDEGQIQTLYESETDNRIVELKATHDDRISSYLEHKAQVYRGTNIPEDATEEAIKKVENDILNYSERDGDWYKEAEAWIKTEDMIYVKNLPYRAPRIAVDPYLNFSAVTFYCAVYDQDKTHVIAVLPQTIVNSESEDDLIVNYSENPSYRYDANGDITVEDAERERTLSVTIAWRDGVGSAYKLEWLGNYSGVLRALPRTKSEAEDSSNKLPNSMIEKIWVDTNNVLHYTIKQKFKRNYINNEIVIRIITPDHQDPYVFRKEIMFVKDGDQGTNGTTYVVALRPCDKSGEQKSGYFALGYNSSKSSWYSLQYDAEDKDNPFKISNESFWLGCFVYRDGVLINRDDAYRISYRWSYKNVQLRDKNGYVDENGQKQADGQHYEVSGTGTIPRLNKQTGDDQERYVKVMVTIHDSQGDDSKEQPHSSVVVHASYPIDVVYGYSGNERENVLFQGENEDGDYYLDMSGVPSYIQYNSSGEIPSFYNDPLSVSYRPGQASTTAIEEWVSDSGFEIITDKLLQISSEISNAETNYFLRAASSFTFDTGVAGTLSTMGVVRCKIGAHAYVIHPIIFYLNTYGNEAINGWDGTSLLVHDKDDSSDAYILAPQVGAGIKNSDNTFTGVVMGKDTGQQQIGLYGYQNGASTFGLKEDGTAYFGQRTGGGQIIIDGRTATIVGGDAIKSNSPADNSMILKLADVETVKKDDEGNITERSGVTSDTQAIIIGKGDSKTKVIGSDSRQSIKALGKFQVDYNGTVYAQNAFIDGSIYADIGRIGGDSNNTSTRNNGWIITKNRLYSGNVSLYSGSPFYSSKDDFAATDWETEDEEKYVYPKTSIETKTVEKDGQNEYQYKGRATDWYRFWAGNNEPIKANFSVTNKGIVKMASATIMGDIYAKAGRIGCKINSNGDGTYTYDGGWFISHNTLSNLNSTWVSSDGSLDINEAAAGIKEAIANGENLSCLSSSIKTENGTIRIKATKKDSNGETQTYIKSWNQLTTADRNKIPDEFRTEDKYPEFLANYVSGKYVALSTSGTYAIQAGKITNIETYAGSESYAEAIATDGNKAKITTAFAVKQDGTIYATEAVISGRITANEGVIGNWKINKGNNYRLESVVTKNLSDLTVNRITYQTRAQIYLNGNPEDSSSKVLSISYSKRQKNTSDEYKEEDNPGDNDYDPGEYSTNERGYFYVTADGHVYCQGANIRGTIKSTDGQIGGWTIAKTYLCSSSGTVGMASSGNYRFWVGRNADYYTQGNGQKYYYSEEEKAGMANYYGPNSNGDTSKDESEPYFYVSGSGKVYCRGVDIQGKITATSGRIGNWLISGSKLYSASITNVTNVTKEEDTGSISDLTNKIYYNSKIYFDSGAVNGNSKVINISSKVDTDTAEGETEIGDNESSKPQTTSADLTGGTFYVTANGHMYAEGARIGGTIKSTAGEIGGWEINSVAIQKKPSGTHEENKNTVNNTIGKIGMSCQPGKTNKKVFWVASSDAAANTAEITEGTFTVVDGEVKDGTELKGEQTNDNNYYFYVASNGKLFCRNASISGHIEANSGEIGGWKIQQNSLTSLKLIKLTSVSQGTAEGNGSEKINEDASRFQEMKLDANLSLISMASYSAKKNDKGEYVKDQKETEGSFLFTEGSDGTNVTSLFCMKSTKGLELRALDGGLKLWASKGVYIGTDDGKVPMRLVVYGDSAGKTGVYTYDEGNIGYRTGTLTGDKYISYFNKEGLKVTSWVENYSNREANKDATATVTNYGTSILDVSSKNYTVKMGKVTVQISHDDLKSNNKVVVPKQDDLLNLECPLESIQKISTTDIIHADGDISSDSSIQADYKKGAIGIRANAKEESAWASYFDGSSFKLFQGLTITQTGNSASNSTITKYTGNNKWGFSITKSGESTDPKATVTLNGTMMIQNDGHKTTMEQNNACTFDATAPKSNEGNSKALQIDNNIFLGSSYSIQAGFYYGNGSNLTNVTAYFAD